MKKNFSSKNLVTVQIIKHLPIGLSVQDEKGNNGIIRVREISWNSEEINNWEKNYPVGWTGKACALPVREDSLQEFSLRLMECDPWSDTLPILENAQVIDGVVVGAFDYGVFIEIAPGINGILHKSRIPSWINKPLTDLFWQGDKVYVAIEDIDYEAKQIQLRLVSTPSNDLIESFDKAESVYSVTNAGSRNPDFIESYSNRTKISRYQYKIHETLNALISYLEFEFIILFSMNKDRHLLSILESAGNTEELNKEVLPELYYSPVYRVAEDNITFVVNDTQSLNDQAELRNLLEFYPEMIACIGVPIESESTDKLALFAFDKRQHQSTKEQILYIQSIASTIGSFWEYKNLLENTSLLQHDAMIGQLTSSIIHEMNNLVTPLQYQIENIKAHINKIMGKANEGTLDQSSYAYILDTLKESKVDIYRLVGAIRSFGRISSKGRVEFLRIDEVINDIIGMVQDICRKNHVRISFTPLEKIIVVNARGAYLQQVILNVVLNAIQQIAELKRDDGLIHIQIETHNKSFYRILINDNGPGIHCKLWEKIFQAGYTTRQDGVGLGLFISRNLIEDMGGNIYVKESYILYGTTFAIEIPYSYNNSQ